MPLYNKDLLSCSSSFPSEILPEWPLMSISLTAFYSWLFLCSLRRWKLSLQRSSFLSELSSEFPLTVPSWQYRLFLACIKSLPGTSLAVQWFRLHATTTGGKFLVLGTKIPHISCSKKKKKKERKRIRWCDGLFYWTQVMYRMCSGLLSLTTALWRFCPYCTVKCTCWLGVLKHFAHSILTTIPGVGATYYNLHRTEGDTEHTLNNLIKFTASKRSKQAICFQGPCS